MSYNYPYSCPQRRYSPVPDRYYHPQPRQYSQSSPSYWNHRPLQYTPDVAATTQVIYPTHYNYPANNAAQQQHSAWAADAAHPLYRPGSANFVNTTSALGYPDESSQRTILTPSPHYSAPIHVLSHHHKNDLPRSPSLSPDYSSNNSWGDVLDDSSQSSRQPSAPLAPSTPFVASTHFVQAPSPIPSPNSVKEEPDDGVGRFIMELSAPQVQSTFLSQSLAPPTEVPLRATQAPPEMRSMMGVFRLNPFAMHSGEGRGIVAPTWCGEEAHPLDEEPIIFEFQVDLEDGDVTQISEQPKESLRAFSPNFELDHGRDELERDQNGWREYNSESAYASTPPTWELDYPPNEEQFSSSESEPPATYSQPRQSSRLYESTLFS